MSETPIGDQVESEVMPAGMVRGVAPHATSEDAVIAMDDPYRIPGEEAPADPGQNEDGADDLSDVPEGEDDGVDLDDEGSEDADSANPGAAPEQG
jgi:hypothetical protein